MHLLLVEDEDDLSRLIQFGLREVYTFVRCACLQDALTELAGHRFDCVVVDLELPDSEGVRTFDRIAEATDIPTVVFSGTAREDVIAHVTQSGHGFVDKGGGHSLQHLDESIRRAVQRTVQTQRILSRIDKVVAMAATL